MEDLVEDHLRELDLDRLTALPDLLRDVFDLDDSIRLHNPQQVLLEQLIVQRTKVRPDGRVARELCTWHPSVVHWRNGIMGSRPCW